MTFSFVGEMKSAVGALVVLGCVLLSGGSRARQHYSTLMTCLHVWQPKHTSTSNMHVHLRIV
jgi:hypothetical protein